MNTAEMRGKCNRLRIELAKAYLANTRNLGYVRRLADEVDALERAIAATTHAAPPTQPNASATLDDQRLDLFFELTGASRQRISQRKQLLEGS